MNVISFSLWGNSKLYCLGALENLRLAKLIYPDWICRFYVAENCPALPILQREACQIVVMPPAEGVDRREATWKDHDSLPAMLWRNLALANEGVERVIFRDTDSLLCKQDKWSTDRWIASGRKFCRIHSHKAQLIAPIMGGLWGSVGMTFPNIKTQIRDFLSNFTKYKEPLIFSDLIFFREVLWPTIRQDCLSLGVGHAVPLPKDDYFVGQVWREELRYQTFS